MFECSVRIYLAYLVPYLVPCMAYLVPYLAYLALTRLMWPSSGLTKPLPDGRALNLTWPYLTLPLMHSRGLQKTLLVKKNLVIM